MLLSKTVIVKWNSRIKKWYEDRGYVFTKMGDEFEVKVEDLTDSSIVRIDCRCDNPDCNSPYLKSMKWQNYKKYAKEDGKYYCKKCAKKLFGDYKCKNTKLKNSISFAQWGIDNLGEDFLEKYWDHKRNVNTNTWEITYQWNSYVWIKCQEKDYHGTYRVKCNTFVGSNTRCPFCKRNSGKVHILDSLGKLFPQSLEVWSHKNKKSSFEYSHMSNQKVWWKCLDDKHEDYKRSIKNSNKYDFRCPKCIKERDESFLQEKVRLHLESLNYKLLHEYDCNIIAQNPKIKNKLGRMPYDNEIGELKLIIEVNGQQHYKITSYAIQQAKKNNSTPEYELHYQKLKDRYKRIFAKSRGYFYLEVPFWMDDKEETWKKLIDDKIKEILERW